MSKITVFFLSSDTALSKSFWVNKSGELCKSSYPNVRNFTSHEEQITTIQDLHAAIIKHANKGHCLIKGKLNKALDSESRAGSTNSEDETQWVCFDLDGAPFKTAAQFIEAIPELKDVAHVVQYSASYGINGNKKLSCHIMMLLDTPIKASQIKAWLIDLNLRDSLRSGITLSRVGATLHWPVDTTACQNDKLLYIAPPQINKGITCSIKPSERIQLVPGKKPYLATSLIKFKPLAKLKEESRKLLNSLRVDQKLPPLRSQTKWVGEYEVQTKPGEAVITGMREDRGFFYFNLNGGDSWSYFHPVGNYELIHCFKDREVSFLTKELLPDYYKEAKLKQKISQSQPTEGGELVLAFRDKRSAQYWNGIWKDEQLELYPAKSELQLNHWLQNHNLPPQDVIPVWDMQFNPHSTVILDEDKMTINTYIPTPYFKQEFRKNVSLDDCPLIKRIMMHAVSGDEESDTWEHWLNWLAVIFQLKAKPKTAWVLHGTEGTGKGLIISRILTPLLGAKYVVQKRASELEEKFTGWLEQALIAFIDEIEVSASKRKDMISGDLRSFITEDTVTLRQMQREAFSATSYTGFIFSSNRPAPVMIGSNDRRYNVGVFQNTRLAITQREIDEVLPSELETFMSYIMTRKADRQQAATAIKNQAHADLVSANQTSIDATIDQVLTGNIADLWEAKADLTLAKRVNLPSMAYSELFNELIDKEVAFMHREITKGEITLVHSRLSRSDLNVILEHCVGNMPTTPNKFTALLKHHGIKTQRMRVDDELVHGIHVTWHAPTEWVKESYKAIAKNRTKREENQNIYRIRSA